MAAAKAVPKGRSGHTASWDKPGYRHPQLETTAVPAFGAKLHRLTPQSQRVDPALMRSFDGWQMEAEYVTDLGYAAVKCLRHSKVLPTTSAGFACITDLTWVL